MLSGFLDNRHALRLLRTSPGFAAVVVVTLAVGIGTNSAIFSLVNEALLRPLPYERPDRIAQIWGSNAARGSLRWGVSLHDFEDWRRQSRAFAEIGVYNLRSANLTYGETPQRVEYALVTPGIFTLLGVPPALGRAFDEDENLPGNDRVVMISHGFWNGVLGADPEVVGKTLILDGTTMTIVGVMPEGFYFPAPSTRLWKPFGMRPDDSGTRDGRWVSAIGRLADGYTLAEAQGELTAIGAALERAYPDTNEGISVFVESRQDFVVLSARPMLLVTWAIVGLVLLIACANVANLLLIRSTARRAEMAIRASLGAGRGRLARQLLSESLVLGLAGGAGGVLVALWIVGFLRDLTTTGIPRLAAATVDSAVIAYAFGLSLITTALFGLAPAMRASRFDLSGALKAGGGRGGSDRGRGAREVLVAIELALSVVVLIGAALLLRTFWSLQQVELGFEPEGRLEARLSPSWREVPERERARAFYARILEEIEALPGIESVGAVNSLPLAGANTWGTTFEGDGIEATAASERPRVQYRAVAGDYFETMGIELRAGRYLDRADTSESLPVAVLSERAARAAWPGESPLGKRIWFVPEGQPGHLPHTVVGVVADVADASLQNDPNPLVYINLDQALWGHFQDWGMSVIARTAGDPAALAAPIRGLIRLVDPTLPLFDVQPLESRLATALAPPRFNLAIIGAFGAAALALAALGIYGIMAFMVDQRTLEIGMRVALGARRGHVVGLIVYRGMALTLAGVALGLLSALAANRTVEGLLFGVTSTDPLAYAGIIGLLLAVAFLACFIPARRAATVDPVICLRDG